MLVLVLTQVAVVVVVVKPVLNSLVLVLLASLGKLWLPAEVEVYGMEHLGSKNGFSSIGYVQYPLFANNMRRVKTTTSSISELEFWKTGSEIRAALTRFLMNENNVPKRWRPVFTFPGIDLARRTIHSMDLLYLRLFGQWPVTKPPTQKGWHNDTI